MTFNDFLSKNYSADLSRPVELLRDGVDNKVYKFTDSNGRAMVARVSKRIGSESPVFFVDQR